MADMSATGSSWFCVILGVAILAEVAVLFVRGRTATAKHTPRGQLPMLASMAVMLITQGGSRLARLHGPEMAIATVVELGGAAGTLYFAIQSKRALRAASVGADDLET